MMDESRQEIILHHQMQEDAGNQEAEEPIIIDSNSVLKPLSIEHLQGGLWVVVLGLVFSILAFFSEILIAPVRSIFKINKFPLTTKLDADDK